ncbi:MAG: hypothetical protein E4H01_12460, partial [Lysobacterales bacterium]
MSTTGQNPGDGEPNPAPAAVTGPPKTGDAAATFTQADLDRIAAAARRETEAKYADHVGLKAKADELDALKLANLTESEKVATELAREKETTTRLEATIAATMIEADIK